MPEHYFFQRILGLICSVFDAYSAVLFLPVKESKYQLQAFFSLGDYVQSNCILEPGQGLVGWILRNNEPLLVNDFDRQKAWLGYYNQDVESQIKAFMGCPLTQGEGALCLDSKNKYSFSPKDQKILHQFIQLIESLRRDVYQKVGEEKIFHFYTCLQLIRELRSKYQRWKSFLNSFLKLLSEYTGFSHCFFASRDERGQGFFLEGWNRPLFSVTEEHHKKFNVDAGLIGWVFRNHRYVSTADEESGHYSIPVFEKQVKAPEFQSVICLPIVVNMRTRGVLVLAGENYKPVPDDMKQFLFLVAEHLTLFLENLYLKNRLLQNRTKQSNH